MTLRQDRLAFLVLVSVLAVSALYQAYRALLMEVPDYDAFGFVMALCYGISVGISAFVLTCRRWTVSVLVLLAVGVFWYYPVVGVSRIEAGRWVRPGGWRDVSGIALRSRLHLRPEPRRCSSPMTTSRANRDSCAGGRAADRRRNCAIIARRLRRVRAARDRSEDLVP